MAAPIGPPPIQVLQNEYYYYKIDTLLPQFPITDTTCSTCLQELKFNLYSPIVCKIRHLFHANCFLMWHQSCLDKSANPFCPLDKCSYKGPPFDRLKNFAAKVQTSAENLLHLGSQYGLEKLEILITSSHIFTSICPTLYSLEELLSMDMRHLAFLKECPPSCLLSKEIIEELKALPDDQFAYLKRYSFYFATLLKKDIPLSLIFKAEWQVLGLYPIHCFELIHTPQDFTDFLSVPLIYQTRLLVFYKQIATEQTPLSLFFDENPSAEALLDRWLSEMQSC